MALSVAGQTLARFVVVLLVLVVPLRTVHCSVQGFVAQFDCLTMLPEGRQLNEAQTMITPCPIAVNIGQNFVEGVEYTPGKTIRVEFKVTRDSVSSVFCRASQVLMDSPLGIWIAESPFLLPYTCQSADDALQSNGSKPISTGSIVVAYWTPPSTPGYGDMEIDCTVVDNNKQFWNFNSFVLSEVKN